MGVGLRKTPKGVKYESSIPYAEDSYYRAIGDEGLQQSLQERAILPGEKFAQKGAGEVFYSKGYPEAEYVTGSQSPIVEVKASDRLIHGPSTNPKLPNNYYYTNNSTGPISLDERVRIWAADQAGGTHRMVYDNITPWKYVGRNALRAVEPIGAAMLVNDAAEGLRDKFQSFEPTHRPMKTDWDSVRGEQVYAEPQESPSLYERAKEMAERALKSLGVSSGL